MIRRRSTPSTLRTSLYVLAIACTVPVSLFAAGLVYFLLKEDYTRTQRELFDRASLLAGAVELRIRNIAEDLQVLSVSPALAAGDFVNFRTHMLEAGRVIGAFGVVLVDRQGQLILSTRREVSEPLPKRTNLETQEKVFLSGEVQVSDLVESTAGAAPIISVEVPIRIHGEVMYVLAAGLSPEYLADVVASRVPAGWIASIVDRKGLLIARAPDLKLIGQPIIAALREHVGKPSGSWIAVPSRTGGDAFASFTQLPNVGWTIFVSIPREMAEQDARRSVLLLVAIAIVALLLSLLLARRLSGRIIRTLNAFEKNVVALRSGDKLTSIPDDLIEVNRMQNALARVKRELDSTEQRIESERKLLKTTVESMPVGVVLIDSREDVLLINDKALQLWSASEIHNFGDFARVRRFHLDGTPYPPREWPIMRALRDGVAVQNEEVLHESKDGQIRLSINAAPIYNDVGRTSAAVAAFYDVTDLHRALDEQKLLLDEINHRVKNTMAAIQSIALLSRSSSHTVDDYVKRFQQRLVALGKAYNLLTENNWRGADVRQIVQATTAPYGGAGQIYLEGEAFEVPPKGALALTSALQELNTNAAKYGALSVPGGQLHIQWKIIGDSSLELIWTESNGPPVQPPARRGFGSKLIEDILTHDQEWTANIQYRREGVIVRMTLKINSPCVHI